MHARARTHVEEISAIETERRTAGAVACFPGEKWDPAEPGYFSVAPPYAYRESIARNGRDRTARGIVKLSRLRRTGDREDKAGRYFSRVRPGIHLNLSVLSGEIFNGSVATNLLIEGIRKFYKTD